MTEADVTPTTAAEAGRTCAVAGQGARDLFRCAAEYPELFAGPGFDNATFAMVTLANAFSAIGSTVDELRTVNRMTLWAFALDWQVDYAAQLPSDLDWLRRHCLDVADGEPPAADDQLAQFLADLRDDLAKAPAFAQLRAVWREELARMLAAMIREWEWRRRGTRVSVSDYLDNADNLGSSFVNIGHWIVGVPADGSADDLADVAPVLAAARAAQVVVRVLNDVASYERDQRWGDLNLLKLVGGDAAVRDGLPSLMAEHRRLANALPPRQHRFATFLTRQVEFCRGFYGLTDFWGMA